MIFEIGRLCIKTAGRDKDLECIVINILENGYVLIDGNTRRKKVNIKHLKPLNQLVNIKKNASHDEVEKALAQLGIEIIKRGKPRNRSERLKKEKIKKEKLVKEKKIKEEPKEKTKSEEKQEPEETKEEEPKTEKEKITKKKTIKKTTKKKNE